jgi:hypothetical protein
VARISKRHPGRKRRIAGWLLLSLAVVVTGVWAVSGWRWLALGGAKWRVICAWGNVTWITSPEPLYLNTSRVGWSEQEMRFHTAWRVSHMWVFGLACVDLGLIGLWDYRGSTRAVEVTLWPLPLLLTVLGVPVLRSGVRARRRALAGSCPSCGYDQRGIPPGSPCPECGKV